MSYIILKKIDRLLLRNFISAFVLLLALVLFTLLIHSFLFLLKQLVGKGLSFITYLKLMFYVGQHLVPHAFPIAILVTALIVFGNFSERFELTAMRSAGIPLQRILRAPFIFILSVGCFLVYFQNYIHPKTNNRMASLIHDVFQKKSALLIQEGIVCNHIPGYSIYVDKKLPHDGQIEGIVVFDYTQTYGTVAITIADKGKLYTTEGEHYLVMELTNGHNYVEALPNKTDTEALKSSQAPPFYRSNFANQKIRISLKALHLHHTNTQLDNFSHTKDPKELREMIKDKTQKVLDNQQKSQNLLKRKAMRYDCSHISAADTVKKDHSLHQGGGAINDNDKDFFEYRDQLIKNNSTTEVASNHKAQLDQWSFWFVRRALHTVTSIKNDIVQQQYHVYSTQEELNKALYEKNKRPAIAMQCIIMFLLAASLGCIVKKGGFGPSILISSIFKMLTYMLDLFGEDWATEGTISAFIGAWLSNLSLLPFTIYFLIKARKGTGLGTIHWPFLFVKIRRFLRKHPVEHYI